MSFKFKASSLLTAIFLSALISVPSTLFLLGIDYLSALLPRGIVKERISKAFSNGDLVDVVHLRTNTKQGAHQYNDCLILGMVFDDRPAAALRALSPVTPAEMPDNNPCAYLKHIASGSEPVLLTPAVFYHRYIHGQVALTAFAMQWIDLATLRIVYDAFAYFSLVTLIVSNFFLLRYRLIMMSDDTLRNRNVQMASRNGFLLVLSLVLLLFYSVQFYGMSLGHAPSDAVVYVYLLLATFVNLSALNKWVTLSIHAFFGVMTAYFELFTGGVPIGVSIILLCFASLAVGKGRDDIWWLGCLSVGTFLSSFIVAIVTKLVVAGSFFGYLEVFTNFLNQLHFWTEGDKIGVMQTAIALSQSAQYLGAGWRLLGVSLLGFSLISFVYSIAILVKQRRLISNWECPSLLILSYASIIIWYIVFRKHAYQHNFFMIRISVMLIADGALLFLFVSRRHIARSLRELATLISPHIKYQN